MADSGVWGFGVVFGLMLVLALIFIMLVTRYKRCASDEILVVFGRVKGGRASRCIHGGATFVIPLFQDYSNNVQYSGNKK